MTLIIAYTFFTIYSILMIFILIGISKKGIVENKKSFKNYTFTVIVPARNEELGIERCLNSIYKQSYPRELFEVVIVNDSSIDQTKVIVNDFIKDKESFKLLDNMDSDRIAPKKRSIELGIKNSKNDIILLIDADSEAPQDWIQSYNEEYQKGFDCIAGPVTFYKFSSIFNKIIALDFLSLITFSAGFINNKWPILCSGANFSYKRKSFIAVDGFKGIDQISSGDDDLLIQKFKAEKFKISYIWANSALVVTMPPSTLKQFINQRVRWGSKGAFYKNFKDRFIMYLVYFLMVAFTSSLAIALLNDMMLIFYLLICIKIFIDILSSINTLLVFKQLYLLPYVIIYSIIHPIYVSIFGILSIIIKPSWK